LKIRENQWKFVLSAVWTRFTNALKSIIFIVYFIIGIVAIGGTGIWMDWIIKENISINILNFFTYSMAILGTLALDGLINPNNNKTLTSLAIILGFIAIIFLSLGYMYTNSFQLLLGLIFTLLLFILVNSNDEKFDDPIIQNYLGNNDLDPNALQD